ncbi:carbohydrate ABC transporter permease [Alkalicoccobacillus gibsonii]|jgi:multiple sugar transport system permease protein|uniref:carbohydrate ABC transporter permease n=1 Tax=Alkalicoccobacillus gibsonii TaxID=79881 RepID=UPI00193319EC|nr:sugar ABC transporter permease [Alkalicoccobacillus gibsonii]MBM0067031.1 sugar ABC transporter permease [Alkalicoccobacillus gibsonii]
MAQNQTGKETVVPVKPPFKKPFKRPKRLRTGYEEVSGYAFISPFIIGLIAFTLYPIVYSLYLSFTNYGMGGTYEWIGLGNYERMFTSDDTWRQSLKVTFLYAGTAVPIRLVFALMVAVALNKIVEAVGLYRTMLYLPSVVGGSIGISIMWRQLFGNDGAFNSVLASIGLPTHSWLGDPGTAIWTLVALYGWQFGSSMLIFLAGLRNIPKTFYEASAVDGAKPWQQFFKITIPLLTPVILFNTIMQTIQGFMAFTPSFIVTNGGPMNSTLLYVLYMYRRAFEFFDMGYASAMAWVMLVIIAIFTAVIFKSSDKWVHYND